MRILLFLFLASVALGNDYPGLPDFGVHMNGDESKEACDARVHTIMNKLTGGRFKLYGPDKIVFENRTEQMVGGQVAGRAIPVTIHNPDFFSDNRRTTQVEIYTGDYNVLHHEIVHVYRNSYAQQRASCPFNTFLNEGLAEMVNWSINPKAMGAPSYRLNNLRWFVSNSDNWQSFREQIGKAIDRKPSPTDYALAGFFACQFISCFPEAKYEDAMECLALDSGTAREFEAHLNALLYHQRISPQQFWERVWENAKIWSSLKEESQISADVLGSNKFNILDYILKDPK